MDGADEALGPWVAAVLITLLACVILAVIVPSAVTVWAARTKRTRLWLVFALIGVAEQPTSPSNQRAVDPPTYPS